jgi:hypothetical protein
MSERKNASERKHLVASTARAAEARGTTWDRREFMKLLGVATTALGAACTGRRLVAPADIGDAAAFDAASTDAATDESVLDANPTGLPSLGGAPDTAQGRTVAAFCDTVLPGRYRDPLGKPGAIDANTPALFFDPALPAAPLVPLLVLLLDSAARRSNGRQFASLSPDEREQTLIAAVVDVPELEFGIQLVKLGFYSSDVVREYLGYPGANDGYRNDPDFTFGVAVATERTTDGNLP